MLHMGNQFGDMQQNWISQISRANIGIITINEYNIDLLDL